MKIVFIGTGNCILDPSRGMPCMALENSDGYYLFDAGSGAIHACIRSGIGLPEIRGVLITHFHVDHVLDVVQLLWLRHIHNNITGSPLLIAGPHGTADFITSLQAAFGRSISQDSSSFMVNEIKAGEEIEAGNMKVEAFKTYHTDESICYRIAIEGKLIACCGDSGPCNGLVEACRNTDLSVLECSYAHASPLPTHMGPPECARVASMSKTKHLVLTHLPDRIDPKAAAKEIRKRFKGKCTIAGDFMELKI